MMLMRHSGDQAGPLLAQESPTELDNLRTRHVSVPLLYRFDRLERPTSIGYRFAAVVRLDHFSVQLSAR